MADDRAVLLYDSGHPHLIVRGFAVGIAFIAGGIDLLAKQLQIPLRCAIAGQ